MPIIDVAGTVHPVLGRPAGYDVPCWTLRRLSAVSSYGANEFALSGRLDR
ncbi:hypothetical protein [Streptomyces sp. NPDC060205]